MATPFAITHDAVVSEHRRDELGHTAIAAVGKHATVCLAQRLDCRAPVVNVEDVSITAWASSWGRAVAAFSPGTLVAAIDREARAVAQLAKADGGVQRASTRPTALSQHCACGARVAKRLSDRVHTCETCKLQGDRDAMAAVLASFVVLVERGDPSTARVDYEASREALPHIRRLLGSPYDG